MGTLKSSPLSQSEPRPTVGRLPRVRQVKTTREMARACQKSFDAEKPGLYAKLSHTSPEQAVAFAFAMGWARGMEASAATHVRAASRSFDEESN